MKKLQDLKISANYPWNRQKVQKTLYLLPDKKVDYLLTELKIVPIVQNPRTLNQTSFLLER